MAIEYRYMRKAAPAVRDDGKLQGRAWPYGSPTQIGSGPMGFRETIRKGAGKKSINDGDIVLLDNHDTRLPLARMSAGTLTMRDGAQGGDWEADIVDTTYGNDVRKNVKAKNYGGCSFGFEVIRDVWTDDDGNPATPMDGTRREIVEMKVHEVSICTFPAYGNGATSVATKEMIRAARGMSAADERAASSSLFKGGNVPLPGSGGASAPSYNSSGEAYTIDTVADTYENECDPDGDGDNDCSENGVDDTDSDFQSSRDAKKPYGDVTYADPGYQADKKKRYPLDNEKHIKAAWGYINQAKNAAKYSASQLASIKSKIRNAMKKIGAKVSGDEKKLADYMALADFREMTEGWDGESRDYDGGVLPDGVLSAEDVNWLARDIKAAASTETRLELIARAADLGVGDILPDRWDGNGGLGLEIDDDVKRDMDEIYTIALSMAPTTDTLRILDLAQSYLTAVQQEQAKRQVEEPDLSEPDGIPLTRVEAQRIMEEAAARFKRLTR